MSANKCKMLLSVYQLIVNFDRIFPVAYLIMIVLEKYKIGFFTHLNTPSIGLKALW
jgi:hypothetical protein